MSFIASRGLKNLVDLVFGLVLATDVDTEMTAVIKRKRTVGTSVVTRANMDCLQMIKGISAKGHLLGTDGTGELSSRIVGLDEVSELGVVEESKAWNA